MCKTELDKLSPIIQEYINIQTGKTLDWNKVSQSKSNSLLKTHPHLWIEWDFEKNNELDLEIWKITKGSGKKAWWYCPKCDDSYPAIISNKVKGNKCSICTGRYVTSVNSLASLNPQLASEWHPTLNGDLTPNNVTCGSDKIVWWKASCGHEWKTKITGRSSGKNCPYCSNQRVCIDNCLATVNPNLAKEWHITKNMGVTPYDVVHRSGETIWWICQKGHEWKDMVVDRADGCNCPYCSNHRVLVGFNDMWTTNPELASLLANPEDGYRYGECSKFYVDWNCSQCNGFVGSRQINSIYSNGITCCACRDGISFPEKVMLNLLNSIGVNHLHDSQQKWSNRKRYDFYIPSLNITIETHGGQHYLETNRKGARTLEDEQSNDKYKYDLAIEKGVYEYIVIDCRKSDFDFIKNNILNSRLAEIFNLSEVDWKAIATKSSKSYYREIFLLIAKGQSNKEIQNNMGLSIDIIYSARKRFNKLNEEEY